MPDKTIPFTLNHRFNYRNIMLNQQTEHEHVGYLTTNGDIKYVRWLGFISRSQAKAMNNSRPVRLMNITRIGRMDSYSVAWEDLKEDQLVFGCLTPEGAYAIYDMNIVLVKPRSKVE